MNDDRLAREIQAALTTREPGNAPASLRARVAAIPLDTRDTRWPGLGGILRGGLRLTAATAAIALLVAVADYGLDRALSGPGAVPPSNVERIPFVVDGAALFSAEATADADRRLDALFRATGIEATLVTQREAADNQLSTPTGFPELYDRDQRDDRDIVGVVGVDPRGTIACCLSVTGPAIVSAQEHGAWRPLTQIQTLTAMLASPDASERDAALDTFVDGVVLLGERMDQVAETVRTGDAARTGFLGGILGLVALVTLWLVRGRPFPGRRRRAADGGSGALDIEFEDLPTHGRPASIGGHVSTPNAAVADVPADRRVGPVELLLAAAATTTIGGFLVVSLVLAPAQSAVRALDTSATGFGLAPSVSPVVALGLLVASLTILMILAARIGRTRWAILSGALVALVAIALVIANEEPIRGERSVAGLGFDHRESTGIQATTHFDYYPVGKGEPFTFAITIRNPGPLPMTILGLPSVFTEPGPGYVPGLEIVGLGTRTGPVIRGGPEGAQEFQPVLLGAGEEVQLVVVGRGGPCAAGSMAAMESIATATHLPIAYSVLGATRVVDIGLPAIITVPTVAESCVP